MIQRLLLLEAIHSQRCEVNVCCCRWYFCAIAAGSSDNIHRQHDIPAHAKLHGAEPGEALHLLCSHWDQIPGLPWKTGRWQSWFFMVGRGEPVMCKHVLTASTQSVHMYTCTLYTVHAAYTIDVLHILISLYEPSQCVACAGITASFSTKALPSA